MHLKSHYHEPQSPQKWFHPRILNPKQVSLYDTKTQTSCTIIKENPYKFTSNILHQVWFAPPKKNKMGVPRALVTGLFLKVNPSKQAQTPIKTKGPIWVLGNLIKPHKTNSWNPKISGFIDVSPFPMPITDPWDERYIYLPIYH